MSEYDLGKTAKEFINAFSNVGSEFIQQIKSKNIPCQIHDLIHPNSIYMSAEEMKKKCVDDLYREVKHGVIEHRYDCNYIHVFHQVAEDLIDILKKRLMDEGFLIHIRKVDDEQTQMMISW
jgi:hypothetical protein